MIFNLHRASANSTWMFGDVVDETGLTGKARRDDSASVEAHRGAERTSERDEKRDPSAHAEPDDADAVVGEAFVA